MATRTSIRDRCRLCYTRLKDSSLSHHKFWCPQPNHRIYNIYKRRPYRYRDLIARYLSINLPENEQSINGNSSIDNYSHVVCGTCASSLNKLDTAFRTFQQTQKSLRVKFRKTSQIINYHLDKQIKDSSQKLSDIKRQEDEEKHLPPKRQSKRKGAPKHIDQKMNHNKNTELGKTTGGVQLLMKMRSSGLDEDKRSNVLDDLISSTKRMTPRKKSVHINDCEQDNPRKKIKPLTDDHDPKGSQPTNPIKILKPSILTDISINNNNNNKSIPLNLTTISGSHSSNSRPLNSVKGNHIERIAVSLLSGTEPISDVISNNSNHSNGTNDHSFDQSPTKPRIGRRKQPSTVEVTTTNNILSSNIPSPSFDETDDDDVSIGGTSNHSSNTNSSVNRQRNDTNIPNVNKNLPTSISTTPTAEGLTITAINQTGQKQVFMAKQLGNLKKYQCGLCEKIVTNIQIHVRRHTNDKPYPCAYCEKRFTNSGDLQIHVRIHTGEKPYACPLCLKSYRTIGNFNSHVKTHDPGIRPHRCEICQQVFPIPKDWYSHLRSSHRSRTANASVTSSTLNSKNTTTTVTQPLFSTCLTSQQQNNERFIPNTVKLEPIKRSQLSMKSSNEKHSLNIDNQEPVNMTKKEDSNDIDGDDDDGGDDDEERDEEDEERYEEDENDQIEDENHHQSTRNLLGNVSSPVRA